MRTAALERAIGRNIATRGEPCELCSAQLPDEHGHLLDTAAGVPRCTCRACYLLFQRPESARGRYRAVPDRRLTVAGVAPSELGVPVGLAFFTVDDSGGVEAHYPSPLGATRWDVPPEAWAGVVATAPEIAGLVPEVEALLVNTSVARSDAWIVPVTDCYRLVALVRQHWEGLSGGDRVRTELARFFDDLSKGDSPDGTHTRR